MKILRSLNTILKFWIRYKKGGIIFLITKRLTEKKIIRFKAREYLHPILLRKDTSDINTFMQVLFDNEYAFSYMNNPVNIVDCGANIGLATVYFKNRFPQSNIFAIEPEFSNYQMLISNTQYYSNIVCYNRAIYNKETILDVIDSGLGKWGFIVNESKNSNNTIVSSITVEQIMNENHLSVIDILKIDIEGSEKELFESDYEYWLPKCKIIIIEFHDRFKQGCSKAFFNAIRAYNYSIWPLKENIVCYFNDKA